VRRSGGSYVAAQADSAAHAQVAGVVGLVIHPDAFVLVTKGLLSGLSSRTDGTRYFLSAASAGALVTTAPAIQVAIYDAISTTAAIVNIDGGGGIPNPLIIGSSTVDGKIQVQGIGPAGDAIVIDASLVAAAGKVLTVREIDVCDAGVAKKMLVVGSATY
jgi:hypothetical protein